MRESRGSISSNTGDIILKNPSTDTIPSNRSIREDIVTSDCLIECDTIFESEIGLSSIDRESSWDIVVCDELGL